MNEILNEIEANEVTERDSLAVVYSVERLETIPNKDRIELVHMKECGYTAICEKGHEVGDLVVFIKYDSVLPKNELFEFMAEYKYRVKAKSFTERDDEGNAVKKIYSQGIVLPLMKVTDYLRDVVGYIHCEEIGEGVDLTLPLGCKKYIPPSTGSGSGFGVMEAKGAFPTHIISKTDELNLAPRVKALEEIRGRSVYITQKIEGSSISFYLDDSTGELIVCSRNNMLKENNNKFWEAINKHNIKEKLVTHPHLAFQAELYGQGIQKNKLGIDGVDIAIFNVIDKNDIILGYDDTYHVLQELDLPMVPVVGEIFDFDWSFDQLQAFADIQEYPNGAMAEGIVVRPYHPFYSKVLKELWSVKIINREYKL